MGGIEKIVDSIEKLIGQVRVPAIPIPAILMLCSVFRRPGMSAMLTSSKIIKRQSEFGCPTGALPDGTDNKMNKLINVIVQEVFDELLKNSVIECIIPPGGLQIIGFGANGGGPVVIQGTNILPSKATGHTR
jgi:hypothetical protein